MPTSFNFLFLVIDFVHIVDTLIAQIISLGMMDNKKKLPKKFLTISCGIKKLLLSLPQTSKFNSGTIFKLKRRGGNRKLSLQVFFFSFIAHCHA